MNFSQYYDSMAKPSEWNPDATPEGAWDFAIYCVLTNIMRLADTCNSEIWEHLKIAGEAYKAVYPEIYAEAVQSHFEWKHDL